MDLASGLPVVTKTDIVLGRAPRQIAITRGYDGLDRLISEVTPQGSVSYSYDAAGRRTSMSVSGQNAISYAYDNANRLTQITQGSANVTIVPDSDGRRQSLTLPNSVKMAYSYDAASQLTGIRYTQGSNTLGSLSYAYDLAGRRMNVGGAFARTGVPQAVSSASYNVNNQLTNWKGTSLTYDANGNLINDGTNRYMWNARNQLVAISGPVNASFQYDAFGRRVSKTIGGTTQFLYDGVNPVQEISGTSASANLLTGGVDEYFQLTDSAGARNFLTDALGSTLALSDSTGTVQTSYTFEPFGNTTVSGSSNTNSFAYTGRELDPTGLYFYRARYYNPQIQRFISEDPIGFVGGINQYAYGHDNPINQIDPFGTSDACTWGGCEGRPTNRNTGVLSGRKSDLTIGIRAPGQSFGGCMIAHGQDYSIAGVGDLLSGEATGADPDLRGTFVGGLLGGNHIMGLYSAFAEGDGDDAATLAAHGAPEAAAYGIGNALTYGRRTSDIMSLNLAGKGGVPRLLTAAPKSTEFIKDALEDFGNVLNLGMELSVRLAVDAALTGAEAIGCSLPQ